MEAYLVFGRLYAVEQVSEQALACGLIRSKDARGEDVVDEEMSLARLRMRAYDGVRLRRIVVAQLLALFVADAIAVTLEDVVFRFQRFDLVFDVRR